MSPPSPPPSSQRLMNVVFIFVYGAMMPFTADNITDNIDTTSLLCFALEIAWNILQIYSKIDVCGTVYKVHLLIGFTLSSIFSIRLLYRISNWIESVIQTDSIHTQIHSLSLSVSTECMPIFAIFSVSHTCCVCQCDLSLPQIVYVCEWEKNDRCHIRDTHYF